MTYSDKQIKFIKDLWSSGDYEWQEVATLYNEEFDEYKTANAIRKTYKRFEDEEISDDTIVKNMESARKKDLENKKLKKQQTVLLDSQITVKEVLEEIKVIVNSTDFKKLKFKKSTKSKRKKNMIIEPFLSDLHIGLKTRTFSAEIAEQRLHEYTKVVLEETKRYEQLYNIEKYNLLLNGDLIQSATMHKDSGASCHLTNAQQLAEAIRIIFQTVVLPIASTGYPVDIIGMCGNHDREARERFTANPGETYYTYTIYKTIELICKEAELTNVTVTVPDGPYHIYSIFDKFYCVEHGDLISGKGTAEAMEKQLSRRSVQSGKLLSGIRSSHLHEDFIGSMGRYIRNGGLPSDDHFSSGLGYPSRPAQLINYYVDTDRDTNYYHTLVVNLSC